MNKKRLHNYFLFSRPSLRNGIAKVLDLGGTFNSYNTSKSPEEADRNAIADDWKAIGEDMTAAFNVFSKRKAIG